jgi:hypothetical protein
MFVLHGLIEVLEVNLAPVAAVSGPSAGAWLHLRIGTREIVGELRLVFIDQ